MPIIVPTEEIINERSRELVSLLILWSVMEPDIATETLKDDARGIRTSDTIFSDLDTARLSSLPCAQPHREVDQTLVGADKLGNPAPVSIESCSLFSRLCQDIHRSPYTGLR